MGEHQVKKSKTLLEWAKAERPKKPCRLPRSPRTPRKDTNPKMRKTLKDRRSKQKALQQSQEVENNKCTCGGENTDCCCGFESESDLRLKEEARLMLHPDVARWRAHKQCSIIEIKTYGLWSNLKKADTVVHYSLPKLPDIQREKMLLASEQVKRDNPWMAVTTNIYKRIFLDRWGD